MQDVQEQRPSIQSTSTPASVGPAVLFAPHTVFIRQTMNRNLMDKKRFQVGSRRSIQTESGMSGFTGLGRKMFLKKTWVLHLDVHHMHVGVDRSVLESKLLVYTFPNRILVVELYFRKHIRFLVSSYFYYTSNEGRMTMTMTECFIPFLESEVVVEISVIKRISTKQFWKRFIRPTHLSFAYRTHAFIRQRQGQKTQK